MSFNDIEDPVLLSPSQLVSSSKLSKNLGAYLEKIKKRPVFITREQEVEAVLINIDDYRDLLLEEQRVEELYYAVLALRRLFEHFKSHKALVDTDDVLKRFGLTREEVEGVPDDAVDG
ncbi:type II toxin-antitoxin system Phd/YefM family antitoxin [Desulfofundulus sp. TPOSR]|uniref:type II toxin-antitoxin system Phd/YefM family antitoxin n=1 Tax=Desulfofundulus sp. TPOSR TaxID=2714340 RepID=UPI001409B74E|nr:type II toxin-antitoxin system Phd/YefM family antitoxin [Desulfofundulus sp. TPOSR]NHM28023.1 type II toxin-antitoxin system Phd/YefM family antitoxin [Desulfofundulus sp. TPOSR]